MIKINFMYSKMEEIIITWDRIYNLLIIFKNIKYYKINNLKS